MRSIIYVIMARQLRIEYEGAFYHITSRGNLREKIFFEDKDKEKFLEILERTKERYGYFVHAYALMDNHYHLLIETPYTNIKQIMQNINTSYTVYINIKYRRSGHLFQGRYKSIIVDKETYLLELSRYIHLNPVRAKVVDMPYQYRWTSYRDYLMKDKRSKLVTKEDTLNYFSKGKDKAREFYREFVEGTIGKEIRNPFEDLEAGFILGKEDFKRRIREVISGFKEDEELSGLKEIRKISLKEIIKIIADCLGKDVNALTSRGKFKKERKIAIYLSKILSKAKNIEIGEYFHIKASGVSNILKAVEKEITSSKKIRKEVDTLKRMVFKNEF